MNKALCYGALAIGALMMLLFLLDIFGAGPFGGKDFVVGDVFGFLASVIVVYLGYSALKDAK